MSILAGVDWNDVLKTIGTTAVMVAILGFLGQVAIKHLLTRDVETHKANLRELLLKHEHKLNKQMEAFKTSLYASVARDERIRQEIIRWANPILGVVLDLQRRLKNILVDQGYLALSPSSGLINSEWSVSYEYFFPSTVFLFCQYFCWIRLFEEELSFELFEKHDDKDKFRQRVSAVRRTLSSFPLSELGELPGLGDRQVFSLQQRGLGEMMIAHDRSEQRCMRFSEFTDNWREPEFSGRFDPLIRFLDRLEPTYAHRWKRLELMAEALGQLRSECEHILDRGRMKPQVTSIG